LIEKGIDVNCKNDGRNALRLLCEYYKNENLIDIIRFLIEKGINVNYKDIVVLRQNYRKENCSQIVDLLNQHVSYCDVVRYYCSQIGLALVYCFRSYCRPYAWRYYCSQINNLRRDDLGRETCAAKICNVAILFVFLFFLCCMAYLIAGPTATTTVPTATPDPFVNNDSFINKAFHD
jgi:hypothetical protein